MSFLDEVSMRINQGRDAAERMGNSLKLQSQLNDINKQRQALAAQLGASLYEATKGDTELYKGREALYDGIASLDARRDECNRLLEELASQAQAAEQMSLTYTCVLCGATLHGNDLFCTGCGAPADEARGANGAVQSKGDASDVSAVSDVDDMSATSDVSAEAEDAEMVDAEAGKSPADDAEVSGITCPTCGVQVEEGHKFCMSCGTQL